MSAAASRAADGGVVVVAGLHDHEWRLSHHSAESAFGEPAAAPHIYYSSIAQHVAEHAQHRLLRAAVQPHETEPVGRLSLSAAVHSAAAHELVGQYGVAAVEQQTHCGTQSDALPHHATATETSMREKGLVGVDAGGRARLNESEMVRRVKEEGRIESVQVGRE